MIRSILILAAASMILASCSQQRPKYTPPKKSRVLVVIGPDSLKQWAVVDKVPFTTNLFDSLTGPSVLMEYMYGVLYKDTVRDAKGKPVLDSLGKPILEQRLDTITAGRKNIKEIINCDSLLEVTHFK